MQTQYTKCVIVDYGESLTKQFNIQCHAYIYADTAGRVAQTYSWGVQETMLIGLTYEDFGPDARTTDPLSPFADPYWDNDATEAAHQRAGIPLCTHMNGDDRT